MQTFTIFFGFAVIAIAIENFTANFHLVKSNDARTKGHQEIQSRGAKKGFRYFLHGATGTEKVTIRDGNNTVTKQLKKEDEELYATNPKITIEYTNDECCDPEDKNVLFTPDYKYKISTNDNKNNYFENWNCSTCYQMNSPKIKDQMNLQSRSQKPDNCYKTRLGDDCLKCSTVKDGQFCYPGNYTIEFKTEGKCDNVTFGECNIPQLNFLRDDIFKDGFGHTGIWKCNKWCAQTESCKYYRYHHQTGNCTLWDNRYKAQYCNILAAPWDKTATACLKQDTWNICESIADEECEYDGQLEYEETPGEVVSPDICREQCEMRAPDCKYWIFKKQEKECILKRDGKRRCKVKSGEKMTVNDYGHCISEFINGK